MSQDEVERWRRMDELFDQALALPPAERSTFLSDQCGDDAGLRAQVESLLAAHGEADTFLEAPPVELIETLHGAVRRAAEGAADAGALVDRRIGPYRVLRAIGQGGMGEVYLAERADGQFEQRVAIKRIRGGFASAATHDRFRLERQILARLEHPYITRLLDGGVDDEGCPYLVMEYVEGTPITRYCDEQRLSVEQRVVLFERVCRAVHHAHRNLIVHRDLKPTNILVSDGGEVKLLDFGIAKLLDDGTQDEAAYPVVVTQSDVRLMTPGYASPEQVRGEPVTTASDVYALGVILYELLTGRMPYRLSGKRLHEVERVIAGTAPEKPSTAVLRAQAGIEVPERVGKARGTTLDRLRRQLAGDLDTIVLMALRKEPERRYASAEQLAEDLARYRAGRPVQAQRDTFSYRATKFVRRNWAGVAAGAAVLLALVGGLGAAAWQARIATQEAAKARHINEFLLEMLASADPEQEGGRSVTVAEVLDAAAAQLETKLRGQPALEVELRSTLGTTYRGLGLFDEAEPQLQRALTLRRRLLGAGHPEVAFDLNRLAMLYNDQGRFDEAERLFREAVTLRRPMGPDDVRLGEILTNLGLSVQKQGRYDEADSLYREALAVLWQDTTAWSPQISSVLNDYATLLHAMGRFPEAEGYFRRVLGKDRTVYAADSYGIGILLNNLSQVLQMQGKFAEAEGMLREALSIYQKRYGEVHPQVALTTANLASMLQDLKRDGESEALYRRALDLQRQVYGAPHLDIAQTMNNLASLLQDRGDFAGAEPLQREAMQMAREAAGASHPLTAILTANLGRVRYEQGRLAEAEPPYREALTVLRDALPDHPHLAKALVGLGLVRLGRGDAAEAEALLREGLTLRRRLLPEGDWQTAEAESALGAALSALGRAAEADSLLTRGYETLRAGRGPADRETRRARTRLEAARR